MGSRVFIVAVLTFHFALSSEAALLTVTSLADSGPGSLRDQVAASLAGDTIDFATNGTMVLSSVIVINHTLFVKGPGPAKLTVSGNATDRVFITGGSPVVLSGMTISNGLVLAKPGTDGSFGQDGGAGGDAFGGGIANGISSSDTLIVSNCWFVGNVARGGHGGRGGDNPIGAAFTPGKGGAGGVGFGGALYSKANIAVLNCTFSDNHAIGGDGGDGGNNLNFAFSVAAGLGGSGGSAEGGGADVSTAPGTPAFTNCTFSGNVALGGAGGIGGTNAGAFPGGNGGNGASGTCGAMALLIQFGIVSCTIVSNTAVGGAAGTGGFGVPVGVAGSAGTGSAGGICGYAMLGCVGQMGNSVVADNFASTVQSNCYINVVDLGFNYIGDNDYFNNCGATMPTRIGTVAAPLHAQVGPLAQNGSGLPTHAPLNGSPLLDWGFRFDTTTDERRAPRPFGVAAILGGDGSDIGAFEFGSTPLGVSIGGTNGTNVVITWPACYGDFLLQSSTDLSPNNWSTVTDSPAVVEEFFTVTNGIVGPSRFYRLIRP